jgi:guanosine-3',5'-bis(diphosphate) 3'-pyrophosphohydrolase
VSHAADNLENAYRPLLDAVAFAARAHRGQLRKDGETPYASHVFRVCLVLRHVFGITDHDVLMAAVLHDTIEDTTTDYDDLEEKFGSEVAGWVATLSKDKRAPYEQREVVYAAELAAACWQVQVCKLADLFDNLLDTNYLPPPRRRDALRKKERVFQTLQAQLKPEAREAGRTVARLFAELEARYVAGR